MCIPKILQINCMTYIYIYIYTVEHESNLFLGLSMGCDTASSWSVGSQGFLG